MIGAPQVIIIIAVALLFFGGKKIPELMRGLGGGIREFKDAMKDGEAEKKEAEVIIAGAGLAAHLPGVIASKTVLPVIGVPLNAALGGTDSLYSIVQMPKSIPVATVGIDNSYNAGMLAVEILAIKYSDIKEKLIKFRKEMKEKFISENENKVDF